MTKLVFIILVCLFLSFIDGLMIRFGNLSLSEALVIFACFLGAVIVWTYAMNLYINKK